MASKTDLTKLRHIYTDAPLHLYYETTPDGKDVIRRIRVQQHTFATPTDGSGITIDTVPPNSVGTAQIEDGSVQMEDLAPEVKEAMENQFATDDDVKSVAAAANETASQVENAKGSYATLAARLDAKEVGLVENTDPMSLYI